MKAKDPTREELEQVFEYKDGQLWRKSYTDSKGRKYPSSLVTNVSNSYGYCLVRFKNRGVKYHRIVWILLNGSIPDSMQIDHINGNRIDNSIENLRIVDYRQNSENREVHRKGKLPGCSYRKDCNKWQVRIRVNGCRRHIGLYDTELEAYDNYKKHLHSLEA